MNTLVAKVHSHHGKDRSASRMQCRQTCPYSLQQLNCSEAAPKHATWFTAECSQ